MDNQTAIRCKNLEFAYHGDIKALRGISIEVPKSEKVALIGPNGAGKSTFLLQLNGVLRGTGHISIGQTELSDKTLSMIRRKVGIIFQDPNDQLFCPTVFDDVAFGPLHFGMSHSEIKDLVTKSLESVELNNFESKSSHHISLGERKRVAMAAVFACRPEILLMDEPSANLDPKHRRDMINMINNWNYTTVIATHDLDLAWETCSRCIILNKGEIIADDSVESILKNEDLLRKNSLELPLRFQ